MRSVPALHRRRVRRLRRSATDVRRRRLQQAPACLAAERAHAEAIAQARREVAAEIAVWLHDVAECDPEHPRSCGYAEAAVDIRDRWA